MANLRTNNLSGEQGQNAYRGSVYFAGNSTGTALRAVESDSDLTFGTGDFTIEFWILRDISENAVFLDWRNAGGDQGHRVTLYTTNNYLYYFSKGANRISVTDPLTNNSWHHVALARASSSTKLFVNGVQVGSTYTDATGGTPHDYVGPQSSGGIYIGKYANGSYDTKGYISNLRMVKGTALYTSDFTPPQSELTVVDGTVLLCCQDSDDATKDAVGTTITTEGNLNNTDLTKQQPKVIPPYGVDAGNTFGGSIQQSSQGYMYFPTGRTEERSRGFVVFAGGLPNTGNKYMDIVHIPTGGNTVNYGDLLYTKYAGMAVSSSTRGIWAGGFVPGYGGSASNVIESTELASHSNTTDFGDLTVARGHGGGVQNSTRGVFMTGYTPSNVNTIDFITMATLGDATDFGDVIDDGWPAGGGRSSSTRGVLMGHGDGTNRIQFITIMTTGNSQDFGDLNTNSYGVGAGEVSDGLRGIAMGGSGNPGNVTNVIDFITIATTGNATEFGDLTTGRRGGGAGCTLTKGILAGGRTPTDCNIIDSVVIQSTGNAVDFGDTTAAVSFNFAGCSDSHGGLT
tara:strand:+ start:1206 stop:2912 length:1707 start_codon:yes stop_codon:yes gene_type:complete